MARRAVRPVTAATRRSIKEATDRKLLDPAVAAGPIAAILAVATKIDTEALIRERYLELDHDECSCKPPGMDTVSLPTYLQYAVKLGLTPVGDKAAAAAAPATAAGDGEKQSKSKLGELRAVATQRRPAAG